MPLKNTGVEINTDAIESIAGTLGIELSSDDPDTMVEELREAFVDRLDGVPEDEWIKCEVCGEVTDSDDRITFCPFCGDEGEDDEPEPIDGADYDDSPDPEEAEPVDLNDPEPIDGADYDDSPDLEEAEPVDLNEPEPEKAPSEPEKAPQKPAKKKGRKKVPAKKVATKGAKGAKEEKPTKKKPAKKGPRKGPRKGPKKDAGTAIIPEEKRVEMLTELNVEKKKIKAGQQSMLMSGYDLGESLRKIYTAELWRAEGHKDFRAFCKAIGISHTLAYNLMKIVDQFTLDDFMQVGQKKLALIARADSDERPRLLEEAKKGKSARQIEANVKGNKGKGKGKSKDEPSNLKGVEGGTVGRPKIEDQTLTLLSKVGGKAQTFPFRSSKDYSEVSEWSPDTYVEIPISDRVVQYIVLKTDKTGKPIGITTAFRKVEESATPAK